MLRRARELLERATRGGVRFPRQVIALFTEAIHLRNGYRTGDVGPTTELDRHRESFDDQPAGGWWGSHGRCRRYATPGEASVESLRAVVRVRVRPAGRADELAGGAGDPAGGGEPEGVGREPNLGGSTRPRGVDVRAGNVPPPSPLDRRSRQPDVALVRQPAPTAPAAVRGINEFPAKEQGQDATTGERIRSTRGKQTGTLAPAAGPLEARPSEESMRWRNWMIGMFIAAATIGGGGFWHEVDWWYYVQDSERGPWPKIQSPGRGDSSEVSLDGRRRASAGLWSARHL